MMPASKEEEQQQVQMAIKASMEDRKNVVSDSFLNEGSQNAPFEKKVNNCYNCYHVTGILNTLIYSCFYMCSICVLLLQYV